MRDGQVVRRAARRNVDTAHGNVTHTTDREGCGMTHRPSCCAVDGEGRVRAMVDATGWDTVCGTYGNCIGRDGDGN